MFTGIVEEQGLILAYENGTIRVQAKTVLEDTKIGDSISVDGCCLTVVRMTNEWWEADISEETRRRTTIDQRKPGDSVNLERAARIGDAIGGHFVQGHVDAVGEIAQAGPDLHVRAPQQLMGYFVEKGSVAVDGVSLTIVDVVDDGFTVALIPHTMSVTTLGEKKGGDLVNLEADILAKHVDRLLAFRSAKEYA